MRWTSAFAIGAGTHVLDLSDAADLGSGVYLVRLTQGVRSVTARACLIR